MDYHIISDLCVSQPRKLAMLPRLLELICEYEPIWFSSWGTSSLLGGQGMLILNLLQRVTLQYYGSCYRLLMQIKRFLTIRNMKNSNNKTFKAFMLSGHQSTGFIVTGQCGIPLQCSIVWLTNLYCLYLLIYTLTCLTNRFFLWL